MQLLMRRPEINGFVSISPPANLRDFSFLAPCPSSGLIMHGDKDNIASFDSTKILVEKLTPSNFCQSILFPFLISRYFHKIKKISLV